METKYVAPAQKVPLVWETDVAVIGGGTAGPFAAMAAAREGADVCLIESSAFLGGAVLQGPIPSLEHHFTDAKGQRILGGLPVRILTSLVECGYTRYRSLEEAIDDVPFVWIDPQGYRKVMTDKVKEEKVRLLLNTRFSQPITDNLRLTGVIVETPSGRQAVLAKVLVDCTGDAAVAHTAAEIAGCPGEITETHRAGTMGLMISLRRVDFRSFFKWWETHPNEPSEKWENWLKRKIGLSQEQLESSRWRMWRQDIHDPRLWPSLYGPKPSGLAKYLSVEDVKLMGGTFLDQKDQLPILFPTACIRSLVKTACEKGELELERRLACGAKIMFDTGNSIVGYGCPADGYLCLNMTRVVDIDATDSDSVTEAEIEARDFQLQQIAFFRKYLPGFVDCEAAEVGFQTMPRVPRTIVGEARPPAPRNERTIGLTGSFRSEENIFLPYGMLLPKKLDNILVAGKASAGGSLVRGIVQCQHLGEVAGIAAALSVQGKTSPRNLSTSELQKALLRRGVLLEPV